MKMYNQDYFMVHNCNFLRHISIIVLYIYTAIVLKIAVNAFKQLHSWIHLIHILTTENNGDVCIYLLKDNSLVLVYNPRVISLHTHTHKETRARTRHLKIDK